MKHTHVITTRWATYFARRLDDGTLMSEAAPPCGPSLWTEQPDGSLLCDGDPYPTATLMTLEQFLAKAEQR